MFSTHHCLTLSVEPWLIDTFQFFCVVFSVQLLKDYSLKTRQYRTSCLDLKSQTLFASALLLRKEVIQPHLPIRLPCYDFTPVIAPTLDGCSLAVSPPASGVNDFRGVTGGVYKARERIHRCMLTSDY